MKVSRKKVLSKSVEIEIDYKSKSCFLFSSNNKLRMALKSLIQQKYFDWFINHMIALSSLFLALDTPSLNDPY